LVGLDVVEVNRTLDQSHTTVRVAVEWMSSLFGKKILPWGPKIV
jgi:arginase family enzyme